LGKRTLSAQPWRKIATWRAGKPQVHVAENAMRADGATKIGYRQVLGGHASFRELIPWLREFVFLNHEESPLPQANFFGGFALR
jgi:hypothetical protein